MPLITKPIMPYRRRYAMPLVTKPMMPYRGNLCHEPDNETHDALQRQGIPRS